MPYWVDMEAEGMTGELDYIGASGAGKRRQEREGVEPFETGLGEVGFGPCRRPCRGLVGVVSADGYSVAPCPCRCLFPRLSWICPVPLARAEHVGSTNFGTDSGFVAASQHFRLLGRAREMQLAWIPVAGDGAGPARPDARMTTVRSVASTDHPAEIGLRQALEAFVTLLPALSQKSMQDLYPGCVIESSADQRAVVTEQQMIKTGLALRASSEHFVVLGSEVSAVVRQGFQVRRVAAAKRPSAERNRSGWSRAPVSLHDVDPQEIETAMSGRCVLLALTSGDLTSLWRSEVRREQLRTFVQRLDSGSSSLVLFAPQPPFDAYAARRPARVGRREEDVEGEGRESFVDSRRKLRFRSARMANQRPVDLTLENILDDETFATLILLLHRAYLDVLLPNLPVGLAPLNKAGE